MSAAGAAAVRYPGHLQEPGYNALHFNGVTHGWVSNVRILNSDSAIYCWGCVFSTFQVRGQGPVRHQQ